MAYADQSMSSRRMFAFGLVALLHLLLGYAFITGLAYNVVKKVSQDLKTFDVQDAPPPPEAPPPPPPQQKFEPPPMVSPPPVVQIQTIAPPVTIQTIPQAPVIHEAAPVAPKPVQAVRAQPKGKAQSWLSTDDYPSSAIRDGVEGVTSFRLDIGPDGKPTNCSVTGSSGSSVLDETACKLLIRRARFTPAKDSQGNPVGDTYNGRTRWQIPKD